ncbi:MAG: FAD:protein FMN transferase, partial [Ginsengibacter sp.]
FTIIFYSDDSVTARLAAQDCFEYVDEMNAVFSDYDITSELSKLNMVAGLDTLIQPSPMLYDIIIRSYDAWKESQKKFDITIGTLTKLWRRAIKIKQFPSEKDLNYASSRSGFAHVIIDTNNKTIKILQPGLKFDLGGIAKGYVAQKVVDRLASKNFFSTLVDAGGDIITGNPPPGLQHWRLSIALPQSEILQSSKNILVANVAVATSGATYQHIDYKGKEYSHIIDPETGYGVTFHRNVTVIAKDGATADWLASACSILPMHQGKKLALHAGAALYITHYKKQKLKRSSTRNFKLYFERLNKKQAG